jgi:acetylornithine deacetylase/succinyl-diaminopimelate desuccinylase-like protein
LVSDEEAGGEFGTKYLVDNHSQLFKDIRYAIGEFGGFSFPIARRRFYPIMVAEKQICVLRATIRGTGGHGSLRAQGSATARLARVLQRLDRHPLPIRLTPVTKQMVRTISSSLPFPLGTLCRQLLRPATANWALKAMGAQGLLFGQLLRNTINPTMLRGGDQINVVPSEIVLGLDGRLLPGQGPDDLMSQLRNVVGDEVELEVVHHYAGPPEPDMGLFGTLADILHQADPQGVPVPMLLPGATDGRFLAKLGIQSYGFLPMSLPPDFNFSQTIHGLNERIPAKALDFGSEAIYQLLRQFDQGHGGPTLPSTDVPSRRN